MKAVFLELTNLLHVTAISRGEEDSTMILTEKGSYHGVKETLEEIFSLFPRWMVQDICILTF